jgi:hypothetical protein
MKLKALKKVIKEVVKEVIQEEIKDILLEALKSNRVTSPQPVVETRVPITPQTPPQQPVMNTQPRKMSLEEQRDAYKNILGETERQFTSQHAQNFVPKPGMDTTQGQLPTGDVGMDQIMNLMNTK